MIDIAAEIIILSLAGLMSYLLICIFCDFCCVVLYLITLILNLDSFVKWAMCVSKHQTRASKT